MAQGLYKNGEIINLTYQAVGCLSGAAPTGIVYDEAGSAHSAQTTALNAALAAGEIADGRYHGHFTPDAEGRWTVVIADKNGDGEVSKNYNVCGHNIDEVGDDAATAKEKATSALAKAASAAAYAASGASSAAVAAIASPAMVS